MTPWIDGFTGLTGIEEPTRRALEAAAQVVDLPPGQVVFRGGDECRNYLLVLDGSVRVQMTAESGREIVLYRVEPGESCVLTTACLLADEPYAAEGVTETPVRAVAVPAATFRDILGRSAALRDFVFATYGARIADLMLLVEEVAFGRVDLRLARLLIERRGGDAILMTHQELAQELGTAREVVSRQLKEFERRGLLRLGRGRIAITDVAGLSSLAETGG